MEELIHKLKAFAKDRDWDQFHSPKNLAMALSVEAAEIVEMSYDLFFKALREKNYRDFRSGLEARLEG